MQRKLKDEIKFRILKDNIILAKLSDVNNSFIPAIVANIKRDSDKMLHIDFLELISTHYNIHITDLTEKINQ